MIAQGWSTANFYRLASGVVTAPPATFACWAQTSILGSSQQLLGVWASGSANPLNRMSVSISSTNLVSAISADGTNSSIASTSTLIRANTLFHACAVIAAANDRRAYLNGGGKATETTSRTPSGINRTSIGVGDFSTAAAPLAPSGYGFVVWPAIWNVALTDGEVLSLAQGAGPPTIRPANLVFFAPGNISGSLLLDASRNRNHLTMQGTLQRLPDPPFVRQMVRLPKLPVFPAPAVAASDNIGAMITQIGLSGIQKYGAGLN